MELINCLKWYTNAGNSYVNLPMSEENPLSLKWLKAAQDRDQHLQFQLMSDPDHYHRRVLNDIQLICYQPENNELENLPDR